MTGPVTTEALVEGLAHELARLDGWQDPNALWTDNLGIIARGGEGSPVYLDYVEDARALVVGPLAPLLAANQQVTAERDEARNLADGNLAAGNDELRSLGTFDRKMKIGKHQATNRAHLQAIIAALDEAGHSGAADTLIWQVWHRVNSVARAHELMRLANAEEATATSELARLRAEGEAKDRRIAALEGALAPFAKAGELFGPRLSDDYDQSIYAPAAGPEFAISADHLRAARAATAREG